MALDKLFKFINPKDKVFYPIFCKAAENLNQIADQLIIMLKEPDIEKRDLMVAEIKKSEKNGDNLTHEVFENLNKSFITPFDREDIHQLASTIDDVADNINKVAQRIKLYNPKNIIPPFIELSQLIIEAVKLLEKSIKGLNEISKPEAIRDACDKINEIENISDDLYHNTLHELFISEKDAIELIKNKEILEVLEKTIDRAEDVSDVIKTIIVKAA